jgi:hypothetical protein
MENKATVILPFRSPGPLQAAVEINCIAEPAVY